MAGELKLTAKPLHLPAAYGDLPQGWHWTRLDDICSGVYDCPHSTPDLTDSGPYVVRTQDIITGVFRTEQAGHVSLETYAERTSRVTPSFGDLLYSREGTYFGIAAEVPSNINVCLGQRTVLIRPQRSRLNSRYLRYWLNSPVMAAHIHGFRDGSVAERLNLPTIRALPILVPPLTEQKRIAHILGTLDDKIELNRRMNATMEAMARALFKSWFVDFDPVRAKAEGMDAETAALFPAEFQNSPLGPIPKGWSAVALPEAIDVNPSRTLKKGTVAPYLDMKNVPTRGHCAEDVIAREFNSGTKFKNGDTLLARITPCLENGKTAYVDFLKVHQVGWGSTEFIVFSPKPPLPSQFAYFLARSDELRAHAIQNMTGTSGRQRVPSECFTKFLLVIPPLAVARRFDELTSPLLAMIKANSQEASKLAATRDTLLSELLSGKLCNSSVQAEDQA